MPLFRRRTLKEKLRKQLKQLNRELFKKHVRGTPVQMGKNLLSSGKPLAFLSYVQIPEKNRPSFPRSKSRQSWPDNLHEELAETLHKFSNVQHVWLDKMGYPDIKTLGPASGLRPYAMDNGLVVVRGAYGDVYKGYHFVGACGSYLEMVVQAIMTDEEVKSALRWTASSRLWPSAEVAVGIMHGRITATPSTTRACEILLQALDKAIRQLQSSDTVRQDMGFTFFKRKIKCKACGAKLRFPKQVNWTAAIQGVVQTKDRVGKWIDMINNCNGGIAEWFLTNYVVGPMWEADCYDENDRVPVASLTYFMWLQMGTGGTEIYRNLNDLVGKPDAIVTRLMACLGSGRRPKFWYENFEKLVQRLVDQAALSVSSKFGTRQDEWAHAVWYYPSPGRGFFGDLTFSKGKQIVLEELNKMNNSEWYERHARILIKQQRSLWPLVGVSLPWYFVTYDNKKVVMVPVLRSPTDVDGRNMGVQVGPYQYCLPGELTREGDIVVQVPVGGNIRSITYRRSDSQLCYLAFVIEDKQLRLVAFRPCHDSSNRTWANINPESIVRPPRGCHTPHQSTMYGANGHPRDFTNLYNVWRAQNSDFAYLGVLDTRAVYNPDLVDNEMRDFGQSVGWNWKPAANQEEAAQHMYGPVRTVLKAWTTLWL